MSTSELDDILEQLQYGTVMSDNQEPMLTNNRSIAHKAILALIEDFCMGVIPERKPHYKGKEANGYGGNETYELIYSSGRVDVIDEMTQALAKIKSTLNGEVNT